jgi:hypothetical protein
MGVKFRVKGVGFRGLSKGLGFRVKGLELRDEGSALRA